MTTRVPVKERILAVNEELAAHNRAALDAAGVFALNIMASPGAGKTSTILATFERLKDQLRLGVVEGDLASSIDADKAQAAGIPAVQINTGGGCHLDAVMLRDALAQLPLRELDLLLVENVGNLVCPANFDLGTHRNVLIASVPEGDDKPYKYPTMYRGVDVLIVNKIDLLPYVDFDMDYFRQGVAMLNPGLVTYPISCRTREGLDGWVAWLIQKVGSLGVSKVRRTESMSAESVLGAKRAEYRRALGNSLNEIVACLASMPDVEKVILFGSYAAGRRDLFTDLDVLVVMDSGKDFVTRTAELYRRIRVGVDLDLLVYTPEEFERQKRRGFVRQAVKTGKVLYERPGP